MPAPRGNQFWKNRSKHGRDALFTDPALLWESACEYFDWVDKHPLIAIEYNGKDALRCEVPKMRPYTIGGLCLYLDVNSLYLRDFKDRLSAKKKRSKMDEGFSLIIARIEETIRVQKFEGAAAGFLNATIISRDLGLADKQQVESKVEHTGPLVVDVRASAVPLATKESDVESQRQ